MFKNAPNRRNSPEKAPAASLNTQNINLHEFTSDQKHSLIDLFRALLEASQAPGGSGARFLNLFDKITQNYEHRGLKKDLAIR